MSSERTIESRRRPRFRRAKNPPAFQLTDRDVEIVRLVARYRFLRSTHLSQLLQAPHKKIVERLSPLFHAGYLDRPRAQIDYCAAGERKNPPIVHTLGSYGARLLTELGRPAQGRPERNGSVAGAGRPFLLHALAIADFRVALALACRRHAGVTLQEADLLFGSIPATARTEQNPWKWQVRFEHGGASAESVLVPDLVFALSFPDETRRAFLVEIDRGTMPIGRSSLAQTSMLRKFLGYDAGRRQGLHTRRFGWKDFRALIVTSSAERERNMHSLIERTRQLERSALFYFANHEALMKADILLHPWSDAQGNPHSLLDGISL